jgi:hypothetical protein
MARKQLTTRRRVDLSVVKSVIEDEPTNHYLIVENVWHGICQMDIQDSCLTQLSIVKPLYLSIKDVNCASPAK